MKEYIDKLKEIETLIELSIGTTMTEQKATDIYEITNELMTKVKKLNIHSVMQGEASASAEGAAVGQRSVGTNSAGVDSDKLNKLEKKIDLLNNKIPHRNSDI